MEEQEGQRQEQEEGGKRVKPRGLLTPSRSNEGEAQVCGR